VGVILLQAKSTFFAPTITEETLVPTGIMLGPFVINLCIYSTVLLKMPLDLSANTPKYNYAAYFVVRAKCKTGVTSFSSEHSKMDRDNAYNQCFPELRDQRCYCQ
jgi:hypothetical protein